MSINLTSKDQSVSANVCNATWAAIIALARQYDDSIPKWNGCHDGQEWTPEHLKIMADRLEQTVQFIPILRELAKSGGVIIS